MTQAESAKADRGSRAASPPGAAKASPPVSRMTRIAVSALFAIGLLVATVEAHRAVSSDPTRPDIVDFHPFYLAGTMVWHGHFAQSYDLPFMQALQRSFGGGKDVFMPFVYPPLFAILMAPLALLPVGLAFCLFTVATLAAYLLVMRRLAGAWFWHAVLAISPVILIDIRIGQNGLLTAGLAGLAVHLALRRRGGWAGLAAGALAFKPQMATMLPMVFALRRNWRALACAAATGVLLTGVAVLILGQDTVPAFLAATSAIARLMQDGTLPLHRMTSIYACLLSLGLPVHPALAIHGLVAVAVVGAAMLLAHRLGNDGAPQPPADPRAAAGVLLMTTVFVSPYFFDYDLTIFGAGLALALPGLARQMPVSGLVGLLIGVGVIGAMDLVSTVLVSQGMKAGLSLAGPALLVCFGIIVVALSGPKRVSIFRERRRL